MWCIKLIFCMQLDIRWSYSLIVQFLLSVVRHAQACPECSEITNCQYLQKGLSYRISYLQVFSYSWKLQFNNVFFVRFNEACRNVLWSISAIWILEKKTINVSFWVLSNALLLPLRFWEKHISLQNLVLELKTKVYLHCQSVCRIFLFWGGGLFYIKFLHARVNIKFRVSSHISTMICLGLTMI